MHVDKTLSDYELHHADCLDVFGTLEPQSVDAVICDPPYGTTACKWDSVIPFDAMWAGIKRVLRPRGACVLFGSQPFTSALVMSNPGWFRYEWVWEKSIATGFQDANIRPLKAHENIIVFSDSGCSNGASIKMRYMPVMHKGAPYTMKSSTGRGVQYAGERNIGSIVHRTAIDNTGDRYPRSTLKYAADIGLHPTQKPLALLEYLVKTYTNAGDVCLDFAMGSGTTGHACGNLDRRFVGIERDAAYFAIAEERIATAYAPLRMMQVAV